MPDSPAWRSQGFSLLELLAVCSITAILAGIGIRLLSSLSAHFRLTGDARGVSSSIAVAKMRAAAKFTKACLFVDVAANSFRIEVWQKGAPGAWVLDGSVATLSAPDVFGFGAVAGPPPNTQAAIAQAPACLDSNTPPNPIAGTRCVLFNSRGITIDDGGAPTGADAIYLTDGKAAVYGATVSATGVVRLWRTPPTAAAAWVQQ